MIEGHLSLTFVMIYIAEVVVRFAKRIFVAFLGEETNLVQRSGFRSVESIILKQQPIASCLSQSRLNISNASSACRIPSLRNPRVKFT